VVAARKILEAVGVRQNIKLEVWLTIRKVIRMKNRKGLNLREEFVKH